MTPQRSARPRGTARQGWPRGSAAAAGRGSRGHRNTHTVTTFEWFWPHVRPGGLYVIEDMHVARMSNYEDTNGTNISTDILGAWVEQLAAGGPLSKYESVRRLPEGMAFVACQTRGCAIGKRPSL